MEVKVEKEKMMTPKLELVEGAQHESPEISSTQGKGQSIYSTVYNSVHIV